VWVPSKGFPCLVITTGSLLLMSQVVELPLKVSQTAAILEVVHSAVGLVRSPVGITGEGRGLGATGVVHRCGATLALRGSFLNPGRA
jgi:hypothetical protein